MHIVTIDLGGTIIKIGLWRDGKIIGCTKIDAVLELGMKPHLAKLEQAVGELLDSFGVDRFDGLGIAFPGLADKDRSRIISTNEKYNDAIEIDLGKWVRQRWNVPLYIDNDARLATIGEWQYGSARGINDVVMMTLGTGIGTGVVIQGHVLYGKHYQAGSLGGHFIIDYKGKLCSCGNRGCVESLSSSFFLQRTISDFKQVSGQFKSARKKYSFKDIFLLAGKGDKDARIVRDTCMDVWAAAIITYIHAYDPEVVVLGGGVMNSHETILPYINRKVEQHAWTPSGRVPVVASALGDRAALYGLYHCLVKKIAYAI